MPPLLFLASTECLWDFLGKYFLKSQNIFKFAENALKVFAGRLNCCGKKTNVGLRQKVDGTLTALHWTFCPKVSRALECEGFSVKWTFCSRPLYKYKISLAVHFIVWFDIQYRDRLNLCSKFRLFFGSFGWKPILIPVEGAIPNPDTLTLTVGIYSLSLSPCAAIWMQ